MKIKHWIYCCPLLLMLAIPAVSFAQAEITVQVAPPELPVYDQPPIPADGYLWTPGYWAWSDDDQDYYWVPGTWVEAPEVGDLWTPGYWGADGAVFLWHPGYWGPQVGFYGGVNYGYGYVGSGYQGGYWQGGHVFYNRAVSNVGAVRVTNVYNKTVINNASVNRVSFNGGNGGIRAVATPGERAAAQAHHIAATPLQRSHEQAARSNPELRVSANHGNPPIAATARAGAFSGPGVVTARHPGTMSVVGAQPRATPRPGSASQPRQTAPEQRAPEQRAVTEQRAPNVAPRPEPRQNVQPRQEAPRQEAPPHPAAPPRPEQHPPEHPPERPPEH
jgi:hypothetical protein